MLNSKLHIILLCGGEGKRLWPLSSEEYPKQFIKYYYDEGNYISMLQRTYKLVKQLGYPISIITSDRYINIIKKQIGKVNIIIEPSKRDTFPAISLGIVNSYFDNKFTEKDYIVFLPIDSYVENDFYTNLLLLKKKMDHKKSNLGIIGIKPNYLSLDYGYIKEKNNIVKHFIEKPSYDIAKKLIGENYLYNSGIVMIKPIYMINIIRKYINFDNYDNFIKKFNLLPKKSFEYEILEHEKNICCLRVDSKWNDIGTISNFINILDKKVYGNAESINDQNTTIINELDIPIVSKNNSNLFICATKNGIIIYNKNEDIDRIGDNDESKYNSSRL